MSARLPATCCLAGQQLSMSPPSGTLLFPKTAAPAALHTAARAPFVGPPLQVETRATGVEREVAEGCHVEHLGTTVSPACRACRACHCC